MTMTVTRRAIQTTSTATSKMSGKTTRRISFSTRRRFAGFVFALFLKKKSEVSTFSIVSKEELAELIDTHIEDASQLLGLSEGDSALVLQAYKSGSD